MLKKVRVSSMNDMDIIEVLWESRTLTKQQLVNVMNDSFCDCIVRALPFDVTPPYMLINPDCIIHGLARLN